MKKIFIFIMLFIFSITLIGCGNKEDKNKLSVPQNVRIEENIAKWSIVDGAIQYVVSVDLEEFQTQTNSLDLSKLKLQPGEYEVKVKAQGDGVNMKSSDYSKSVIYQVKENVNYVKVSKERYIVKKENINEKAILQYSYSEDKYNVYVYYLGKIESIPLAYGAAEEYDGLSERVIKLTKSSITENSVTESKNYCYTQTNIVTNQVSQNTNVSINVGGGASTVKAEGTIGYAIGKVKTEEQSNSSSFSDAYSAVQSYTESQGEERTYTINQNYETGYFYRVALLGDCDLFAFIVYDCVDKTLTVQYDLAPISNSLYYTIEKNSDNVFDSTSSYKENINFDPNIAIEKGILNYVKESKDLGTKEDPYVLSSPTDLTEKLRYDNVGVYFMLTNDIDFNGREFSYYYTPIDEFKGNLLGNGYAIKNYELSLVDDEISGFFKTVAVTGKIQDLKFENCVFTTVKNTKTNKLFAGVVCGKNNGVISNVVVQDCKLENVTLGSLDDGKDYNLYSGVICAIAEKGSVIDKCGVVDCAINASVSTKNGAVICYVGGLAAIANIKIQNCYLRGCSLSGRSNRKTVVLLEANKPRCYVGGLVAELASGNMLEYALVYDTILSSSINITDYTSGYKDPKVANLLGSLNEVYYDSKLPSTFPKDFWKLDESGKAIINYDWK